MFDLYIIYYLIIVVVLLMAQPVLNQINGIMAYSITRSMPCLSKLYNMFYLNGTKVIPVNIYNLITPIALAQFIMGNGTYYKEITLCTDSYSIQKLIRLINVFIIRYDLNILFNHGNKVNIEFTYKKVTSPME